MTEDEGIEPPRALYASPELESGAVAGLRLDPPYFHNHSHSRVIITAFSKLPRSAHSRGADERRFGGRGSRTLKSALMRLDRVQIGCSRRVCLAPQCCCCSRNGRWTERAGIEPARACEWPRPVSNRMPSPAVGWPLQEVRRVRGSNPQGSLRPRLASNQVPSPSVGLTLRKAPRTPWGRISLRSQNRRIRRIRTGPRTTSWITRRRTPGQLATLTPGTSAP